MSDESSTSSGAVTHEWVRSLPKAEVHVHLEGGFSPAHLETLAAAAGESTPDPFVDLAELLEFLDWSCGLAGEAEDLRRLARDFAARKHATGVRHMDIVANPTHWGRWQGRLDEFIAALDRGFSEAEAEGLPSATLCISILRTQSEAEASELATFLVEQGNSRVAALSIDGNEAATGRTGERFAPAFEIARQGGLRTTVHAGESSGAEGVRDALDLLRAERIDHGVRATEEPALVAELAERGTPLGVTPLANLRLGMWEDLSEHPVEELRAAGVRVSVNTDDPVCPEHSLEENYVRCAETFGWDRPAVVEMVRTGIEASFAPEDTRKKLLSELEEDNA